MTISPDQARELLDGATPGPWDIRESDALMGGRAFYLRQSGKPGIRVSFTTYGHNDDPELIAAAPDLAQTVIDQGKRIEELEAQNKALRNTDTSEWGY